MNSKQKNFSTTTPGGILFIFFLVLLTQLLGCKSSSKDSPDLSEYRRLGDSITKVAQRNLLVTVSGAIADSGYGYAISFCNLNASHITNQVVDGKKVLAIQRLTDRNRNPANRIHSSQDSLVFQTFKDRTTDTLIVKGKEVLYYKPIKIMMPLCLRCHGNLNEMDNEVVQLLNNKYPDDRAVNYKENDLRGMWKVTMRMN